MQDNLTNRCFFVEETSPHSVIIVMIHGIPTTGRCNLELCNPSKLFRYDAKQLILWATSQPVH